jgi:hypothetical protein
MRVLFFALLVAIVSACVTDFDCSLNGVCSVSTGLCTCDSPWEGAACETLTYAVTPAVSKNLWTGSDQLNSWNGPLVSSPSDGTFHLIVPIYEHASLWNVLYYAHGVASNVEGPFDFSSPNISSNAINPAALVFPNATNPSELVYSLWIGGDILLASSAAGPYVKAYSNPQPSNTAPAYYKGAFYVTDQATTSLLTATSLAGPWTTFCAIARPKLSYTVEDPFLYFDTRGNIHIINHAYNTAQKTNCTSSWVSSHFFAASDGKQWGHSDQPYGHTVAFDDGTQHSYCTLERPNLFFGADGALTHIHFAADLITQDEGCASRGKVRRREANGRAPIACFFARSLHPSRVSRPPTLQGCVDCKYMDHAGTLLVKLGAN